MSLRLRVMGGGTTAGTPGALFCEPSDSIGSVSAQLAEAAKIDVSKLAAARVFPVIKGKKGPVLSDKATFASVGMSNNDVLFVSLNPSKTVAKTPGKAPAPAKLPAKTAAKAPPKAVPKGKASPEASPAKKAPPTKRTTPPSPDFDHSEVSSDAGGKRPTISSSHFADFIGGSSDGSGGSSRSSSSETNGAKSNRPRLDRNFARELLGDSEAGTSVSDKRSSMESTARSSNPPDNDFSSRFVKQFASNKESKRKAANDVSSTNSSPSRSDGVTAVNTADTTPSAQRSQSGSHRSPSEKSDRVQSEESHKSGKSEKSEKSEKSAKSEESSRAGNAKNTSKSSKSSKPGQDVADVVQTTLKKHLAESRQQSQEDRQGMERQITTCVAREVGIARSELIALWEKEREALARNVEETEKQRLELIRQATEKEEKLNSAQSEFIEALKQRKITEDRNDEQLEELFRANRELREELRQRRALTDQKIQEMNELHSKSTLMSTDSRIDHILLIQSQISQSLKAFDNIPFHPYRQDSNRPVGMNTFLLQLGLEKYAQQCSRYSVEELLDMPDEKLREIGIEDMDARCKILNESMLSRRSNDGLTRGAPLSPLFRPIHLYIVTRALKKYEPGLADRADKMIETFETDLSLLYKALIYRYSIASTAYTNTLSFYLQNKFPEFLAATNIICNLWLNCEAEFAEMLEFRLYRLEVPPTMLWVHYYPLSGRPYYYNTLCELSQINEPKRKGTFIVREPNFSVPYPTSDKASKYLEGGGPASNKPLANAMNYQPNPSPSDDTATYNTLYASYCVSAAITRKPALRPRLPELLKKYKGRELELLIMLRDS